MDVKDIMPQDEVGQVKCTPVKRRSKGEKTREKILLSAIEILALSGIKGTTHRAIASHANLQLSLTTYYFKDIHELIHQAFKLNSEHILTRCNTIIEASFIAISDIPAKELKKTAVKENLCEYLTEMASVYLVDNIKNHAISLTVEQLMLTEVQVTPQLRLLAQEHQQAELVPYEHLCSFFNKVNPDIDARIIYTVLSQLQYSQLSNQVNIDIELIEQTTRRVIAWVMAIK